ncbi:uncharacterized protein [Argopecten irradians]|uniref:uncharacterized protein n=1 Tax=Argopecten irradians TaxID=31199 RepID=UPI00371E57DA
MFYWMLTAISLTLAGGQHHHGHGHEYHTASPDQVQGELDHLTSHFGDHLCIDLLLLDCRNHHAHADEQICGSDGRTYANHCYFVHATCMFEDLIVSAHGPCVLTSDKPSTVMPTTAMPVVAGSTMQPTAIPGSTMMPTTASTMMTMMSTTVKSSSQVIQSVFCQNKDSIKCDLQILFVCGSNGNLYPNQCELSKAACDDTSLVKVDISMCP